jgi:hypothetical protein
VRATATLTLRMLAGFAAAAGVFILAVPTTGAAALGVIWLNHRRWLTLGKLLLFGAVVGT